MDFAQVIILCSIIFSHKKSYLKSPFQVTETFKISCPKIVALLFNFIMRKNIQNHGTMTNDFDLTSKVHLGFNTDVFGVMFSKFEILRINARFLQNNVS
jgi:hypothetical protein